MAKNLVHDDLSSGANHFEASPNTLCGIKSPSGSNLHDSGAWCSCLYRAISARRFGCLVFKLLQRGGGRRRRPPQPQNPAGRRGEEGQCGGPGTASLGFPSKRKEPARLLSPHDSSKKEIGEMLWQDLVETSKHQRGLDKRGKNARSSPPVFYCQLQKVEFAFRLLVWLFYSLSDLSDRDLSSPFGRTRLISPLFFLVFFIFFLAPFCVGEEATVE